jgi:carboxyl-terminal processing protease
LKMAGDLLHGVKVNVTAPTTAEKTPTDKPPNKAAN